MAEPKQLSLELGISKLREDHNGLREDHNELRHQFEKAFPAGDYEGHCRYHQIMIDLLDERRKLRKTIQEKTIIGLVWLAIASVGTALWHEIQRAIIFRP